MQKGVQYLANVLEHFIEMIGPSNVVQLYTDNASVNLAVVTLVQQKYPHIFFQGCIVHALNLLLKN